MSVRDALSVRPRRVPLGGRTLLRDWVRLAISVGGIGFAMLLILLLAGIQEGTVAKTTTYIDNVGADVFVAREGVTNMTFATSALPEEVVGEVAEFDQVQEAAGIIRLPVIVATDGRERPATLIGYEPAGALGGPWDFRAGRGVERDGETVIDEALAGELGLDLGEPLQMSGEVFTIVGLSGQTANIAGKFVFVSLQPAQEMFALTGLVSFVLAETAPGADPAIVAAAMNEELPGLTATPSESLAQNDRDLMSSLFLAPVSVMATVGFLVGLAIIGLTMYTATAERLRDFGVLKAIGARNSFLFRTVITQATILGLAGFLVGLGAATGVGPFVTRVVPDIGVTITPVSALLTLAAAIAMSLLAAVVPVARIMRVDPLMVFRR